MNNDGMAKALALVGVVMILLGAVACLMLLDKLGGPGPFGGRGQLTGEEIILSIVVGFYHLVFGVLCLGVARVLNTSKS